MILYVIFLTSGNSGCICSINGIDTPDMQGGELLVRSSNSAFKKTGSYCLSSLLAGMELSVRTFAFALCKGINIPAFFFAFDTAVKKGKKNLFYTRRTLCPKSRQRPYPGSRSASRIPTRSQSQCVSASQSLSISSGTVKRRQQSTSRDFRRLLSRNSFRLLISPINEFRKKSGGLMLSGFPAIGGY